MKLKEQQPSQYKETSSIGGQNIFQNVLTFLRLISIKIHI